MTPFGLSVLKLLDSGFSLKRSLTIELITSTLVLLIGLRVIEQSLEIMEDNYGN